MVLSFILNYRKNKNNKRQNLFLRKGKFLFIDIELQLEYTERKKKLNYNSF